MTLPVPRINGAEVHPSGTMVSAPHTLVQCDAYLEGVVSKRADAPYRSGRGEHWLKVKCWKRERFAVVGFVPEGSAGLLKLRLARREQDRLI